MSNLKLEPSRPHIAEKLELWMRLKGFNTLSLSKKSGVAQATIQKILSGQNQNPTILTLKSIADAFNLSVNELIDEKYNIESPEKRVNIISWDEVLDFINTPLREIKNSTFCIATCDVGTRAFALNIDGDGFPDLFRKDTILIFDPDRKPFHRSYVLVKFADSSEPSLKQLLVEEPKRYLKSLNPELAKMELREVEPNDLVLATLVLSLYKY